MTPKLILVSGLPCNGGEDVDKVSSAIKAQLQCLPCLKCHHQQVCVPVVMAWGPGGYSRVLYLQTVLSFRPMEEAAQLCCSISCLEMLRGTVVVVSGPAESSLWKSQNQGEGACGGWDVEHCSLALLHICCWCPARLNAGECHAGRQSNHWETTEEPKPSRQRCAPDVCSQRWVGKECCWAVGLSRVLLC